MIYREKEKRGKGPDESWEFVGWGGERRALKYWEGEPFSGETVNWMYEENAS